MTVPGLENPPTENKKLLEWVEQVATLTQPDRVEWADGSQEEWDRLTQLMVDDGMFTRLNPEHAPQLVPRPLGPDRRGPRRGPHLHLLAATRRTPARPTTGPTRSRCARRSRACSTGSHARPHDVRDPVLDGPARLARSRSSAWRSPTRPYVVVNMRIMTRMGQAALDLIGEDGDFVPAVHSVGYPLATPTATPAPTSRGRATTTSTSCTSPRPARSGPTAPATAATRCWARSASRCASPRRWPATRAGSPSTCSS